MNANSPSAAPAAIPSKGHGSEPLRGISVRTRWGWGPSASERKSVRAAWPQALWPPALFAVVVCAVPIFAQQPPAQPPLKRLQAAIETITRSENANWGIYVKSLESGEEVAINADRQMETMSTIKIPLMVEAFEQIKAGKFKLSDKYTFVQSDSQPGTGTIQRLDPGAVMTIKDLITLMIIVSDNTATEVLYRMVGGPDTVNARLDTMGLSSTRAMNIPSKWFAQLRAAASVEQFYRDGKVPFGLSTPREMGRLLESMERGTLVDKSSSDLMLDIMRNQLYRTRIPRYVSGYRIPHKTGDFLPYVGDDVGVLEAPGRTIVLTIFTGNHFGSGESLENAIGLVAKEVADYFAYRQ
jgi:beta-lactamase class A